MKATQTRSRWALTAPGIVGHGDHMHVVDRAISRRRFITAATGATAAILGSGVWLPGLARIARAAGSDPKPIAGGIQPFGAGTEVFHLNLPAPGINPSVITDFRGFVAYAEIQGTGTGTDTTSGATTPLLFDADVRFMDGAYIGMDGHTYTGTFGFF